MMAATVVKSWEVQRCWGTFVEAVVSVPGKLPGTDTPKKKFTSSQVVPVPLSPVPVPLNKKSLVAKWYWYHSYWYQYQHVIFVGFEQNSNFGARVCSSFDHQFKITKEKGIKAKGKVERIIF